jgi:hypothetical protein
VCLYFLKRKIRLSAIIIHMLPVGCCIPISNK